MLFDSQLKATVGAKNTLMNQYELKIFDVCQYIYQAVYMTVISFCLAYL